MDPRYLPIVDGLMLLALFGGTPLIAATVGYAAWKGKLQAFDRERYALSAATTGALGIAPMFGAQRMHADVRTASFFLQLAFFAFGVISSGIAVGCGIAIFLPRHVQNSPRTSAKS
jgi:hypothetical protein